MTDSVIDRIFDIFARFGSVRYGEGTSHLQHALQAAELARRAGCADSLIAAALLHDIGQFIGDGGSATEAPGVDARHPGSRRC